MHLLLYTALFVVFIPGLFFKVAIPKQKYGAIIAHAVLFTIAVYILQRIAKQYPMLEGFESSIETELNTARTEATKIIDIITNKLKDTTLPTNIRNSLKAVLQDLKTFRGNLKELSERITNDLTILKTRQDAVSKSATKKIRDNAVAAVKNSEIAVKKTTDDITRKIQQINTAKNTATTLLASILRTASGITGSLPVNNPVVGSVPMGNIDLRTVAQNIPVSAPPTTLTGRNLSSSMAIRMGSSSSMPLSMPPQPAYDTSIAQTMATRVVGAPPMPSFGM